MKVFILILFTIPFYGYSQEYIQGHVISSYNDAYLPDVEVVNQNSQEKLYTNEFGFYKIKAHHGDTLNFKSIGFLPYKQEVTSSVMNVLLLHEAIQLQDIEVLAKSNINDIDIRKATSSIVEIPVERIQNHTSMNILESMQGLGSGIYIKTDGELGKDLKVRIRGNTTLPIKSKNLDEYNKELLDNIANQPLYVLNGQIISAQTFMYLNKNDIAEIKVLKDATANALYGIKASNGVIEVSTKRGKSGAAQYTFSSQMGITFRGKPSVDMMRSEEKLEFERRSENILTPGYLYSKDYIEHKYKNDPNLAFYIAEGARKIDSLKRINTDWFKELSKLNSYKSYNLSVRGGGAKNKFYISAGYSNQGGKFDGNQIDKYNGLLNYDIKFNSKITVQLNSGFSFSNSTTPNASNYAPSDMIYRLNPYEQKDKGFLISYPKRRFNDLINQYNKESENTNYYFSSVIYAKIIKDLYLAINLGLNTENIQSLAITPRDSYSETINGTPENERGKAEKSKEINNNYTTNTRINYDKKFGSHSFSITANIDYYKRDQDFIGIVGFGLPSKLKSGAGINNDITGARSSTTLSRKTNRAELGYGSSLLYSYDQKLDLYGSYKADGSSLMPRDKRWNSFWAIGTAIHLNQFQWVQDIDFIHQLQLKANYGKTASLAGVTPSLAVPTFVYSNESYRGFRAFYLKDLFNNNLKPEENTSYNVSLNLGIFKKLNINFDTYRRITKQLLLTVPIAPSNGFTQQLKNVGVLENNGFDFSVNATIMHHTNFNWYSSAHLSYNQNKVIELYDGEELYLSKNPYPDYKEGEAYDVIYGLIDLGVYPADGINRYLGHDGRLINASTDKPTKEDFKVLGHSTPPYTGAWYNSFKYKNLEFSMDLYFNFGGWAPYKNTGIVRDNYNVRYNAIKGQLENTWFEPGDEHKKYPSLFGFRNENYNNDTFVTNTRIGKTDFVRINNIMIRYRFDQQFLHRLSHHLIQDTSLYVQLKNIKTFSNFEGGDPESANLIGSSQPIISFGANILF